MCDLGLAAVFSPVGAYTSIAPPATPGRQANLTHSVPQGFADSPNPRRNAVTSAKGG